MAPSPSTHVLRRAISYPTRQAKALLLSPFVRQRICLFVVRHNREDLAVLKELVEAGKIAPVLESLTHWPNCPLRSGTKEKDTPEENSSSAPTKRRACKAQSLPGCRTSLLSGGGGVVSPRRLKRRRGDSAAQQCPVRTQRLRVDSRGLELRAAAHVIAVHSIVLRDSNSRCCPSVLPKGPP